MSGGSKTQTVTQQTVVPDFLKPYITQQLGAQSSALQNLQTQLQGAGAAQMVAPFNPFQTQAATAMTQGVPAAYQTGQQRIGQIQQSAGRFVDQGTPLFMQGLQNAITGEFVAPAATQALTNVAQQGFQLDPVAQQALQSTAAGQNLFGTPAFNEAVQASIRAARPSVLSTFAQGGSGAIRGGLAQTAMQQAASDAFARLYGQERANQLSAASQLGQFGLSGQAQQVGAAGTLGQLGLSQQGLRNQAIGQLGSALDAERARQAQAAMNQANLGIQGAVAGAQGLQTVGDRIQAQRQAELTAPINAAMMLQQASAGLPLQSLLGQTQSQPLTRNTAAGLLGGAATGAGIGSMLGLTGLGPLGAAAGIGGLLGGFF